MTMLASEKENRHTQITAKMPKHPVNQTLAHHLTTAFLFTKSDFKTVIIPQATFALAAATYMIRVGQRSVTLALFRAPYMLGWMWLHLLVEDITNQRLEDSVKEDALNKPWRPLPAGRITTREAEAALRVLVPLSVSISYCSGVFLPSVTLMMLIWLYNDLKGSDSGPWIRNMINAGGLACFGWGALNILLELEEYPRMERDSMWQWMVLSSAVVCTTVFAQDFPDRAGDRARQRMTIPLSYPEHAARTMLASLTLFWSAICPLFWNVAWYGWLGPGSIGTAIAVITMRSQTEAGDENVWVLWCLWISAIYLLPVLGTPAA
ncbi:UbiA prenyltransferase family-domain-containing protein [Xylariomycetidae sp. FL0641]|nr:UbiA prenyltransferase family-domain-containing protein [Xylariomycetidae sp. FL0641]